MHISLGSIVGVLALIVGALTMEAAHASQHQSNGQGSSAVYVNAWRQARSSAMAGVPSDASNVSASWPDCSHDNGWYVCEVTVTYDEDDDN